jgi:hypothetical protein
LLTIEFILLFSVSKYTPATDRQAWLHCNQQNISIRIDTECIEIMGITIGLFRARIGTFIYPSSQKKNCLTTSASSHYLLCAMRWNKSRTDKWDTTRGRSLLAIIHCYLPSTDTLDRPLVVYRNRWCRTYVFYV